MKVAQTTISAAVEDAMTVAQELRDELQNWLDGMPENLQNGSKADEIREAIDTLDYFCDEELGELPNDAGDAMVTYHQNAKKRQSRSDRRDDAVAMLDAAASGLDEAAEAIEDEYSDDREKLEQAAESCREWQSQLEEVNFPGMR